MEQPGTLTARVTACVAQRIQSSGVTIVWLCEATGIPRSTMTRRLSAQATFTLNELDRIAEALRVSPDDLLGIAVSA